MDKDLQEIYNNFYTVIFLWGCDHDNEITEECSVSMLAKEVTIKHLNLLLKTCNKNKKTKLLSWIKEIKEL